MINRDDITAGFNYGVDTLNKVTRRAVTKTNDFINNILGMKIDERVDFNDMNYEFMKRFMAVNINERDITLSILGQDAHLFGDPNAISGQAQRPSYTKGMNYVEDFVSYVDAEEQEGWNTTRVAKQTNRFYRDPYEEPVNLYPDELDSGYGKDFKKWNLNDNKNSIINKTKRLFYEKKINTIISKFGTAVDAGENLSPGNGDARTIEAGMSHGRNLLQAAAEKEGITGEYDINGYNNPYCRVWTHHYQYDRLDKLIRPFVIRTSNGNTEVRSLKDLHTWKGFENANETAYSWKGKSNDGWEKSVLDNNGFVKITPKYQGGGKNNVHTKDCMFSIENLAWKGYDPYSFEQALSWEQRGPLGGRIMWFPPYGLTFNETTQANWNSNTFIGRGEDVYTYVNTVRSGTLSFIMLTDHPSVIDYANWYDGRGGTDDLTDTDILRFFAGCDSGDGNDKYSLLSKVKPTPLTDEFVKQTHTKEETATPDILKPEPPVKPQPEIRESVKKIQFVVFYPNNYSGTYDYPTNESGMVDAIAYLLGGNGCNKEYNSDESDFGSDIEIKFDKFDIGNAKGYEMSSNGISNKNAQDNNGDYIVGSKITWSQAKSKNIKTYQPNDNRRWYYRIDGIYKNGILNSDFYRNTYDQILAVEGNYQDTKGFNLNLDAEAVKNQNLILTEDADLYSLAEIAYAIVKDKDKYSDIRDYLARKLNVDSGQLSDRLTELINLFTNGKLTEVEAYGYSNSHGSNRNQKTNDTRNNDLATQRATTVIDWLKKMDVINSDVKYKTDFKSSQGVTSKNVSSDAAKKYRSALVTMSFTLTEQVNLSDTTAEPESGADVIQRYQGYTFIGVDTYSKRPMYQDENGIIWYEDTKGVLKRYETVTIPDAERNTLKFSDIKNSDGRMLLFYSKNKEGDNTMNNLRYDQEYYFYKHLEKDNPIVFKKLTEKLKYFDPAFHSMTPEGFTERLTFLQQCTRQGNTVTASDKNGKTASNLAFGRPPFCVLRIGDFYYQTIVIDSINIDYNVSGGLQWDLNPEGNGVQPMLAQINISFKFIGGGDLGGPIRRLQNAMTFNYYANSRLHDNRADRIKYNWDDKTNGAIDNSVNSSDSYAYMTKMADK